MPSFPYGQNVAPKAEQKKMAPGNLKKIKFNELGPIFPIARWRPKSKGDTVANTLSE